jgi:hypothetical protein
MISIASMIRNPLRTAPLKPPKAFGFPAPKTEEPMKAAATASIAGS